MHVQFVNLCLKLARYPVDVNILFYGYIAVSKLITRVTYIVVALSNQY